MGKMGEGVVVLVIGMTIVFSVLILLWAILLGFEQVFYKIPQKKKAKAQAKPQPQEVTAQTVAPVVEEDDTEIVAVITAAICAMTNQSASNFKIKSIRRISNWNK